MAFILAVSSVYSRSEPAGMPTPMRVTRSTIALRSFHSGADAALRHHRLTARLGRRRFRTQPYCFTDLFGFALPHRVPPGKRGFLLCHFFHVAIDAFEVLRCHPIHFRFGCRDHPLGHAGGQFSLRHRASRHGVALRSPWV
jgi:hypothetical protein